MQKFQNSLNDTETSRLPLTGMNIPEITAVLEQISEKKIPAYRAKQIFSWINKGVRTYGEMSNLPLSIRKTLEENTTLYGSSVYKKYSGSDITEKLVLKLGDGALIETVLLSRQAGEKPHYTACLSTQVGCPIRCVFCKTGQIGFMRNLDASEITEQYLFLNNTLKSKDPENELSISNIVIMGMGEPLLNLSALRKALEILCISGRRITISTSGITEGIIDLANNGPAAELAVSVTSAREELRSPLMPGLSKYRLSELKSALSYYREKTGRRITLEMVLLGGINTGTEDARALVNFSKGLDVLINLIPWNPVKELSFEEKKLRQCSRNEIEKFTGMLENAGLTVTRRFRRGSGIAGACGQLGANGLL